MKKYILELLFLSFLLPFALSAQTGLTSAVESALKKAMEQETSEQSIEVLKKSVAALKTVAEQRAVLSVQASMEEQVGLFPQAFASYSRAITLDSSLPSIELKMGAARCALSAGDFSTAESYINSVLMYVNTPAVNAQARLYLVWCSIGKASAMNELQAPLAALRSFAAAPEMASVKPAALFTLWWLTGDGAYKTQIEKEYPKSVENAIVKGEANVLPGPFWFFVARTASAATATTKVEKPQVKSEAAQDSAAVASSSKSASSGNDKIVWQQLGFFKEAANAETLVAKIKKAGFVPEVLQQKRPSGTVYFVVVVKETDGSVGQKLKNAGFECYPVFE